MAIQPTPPYTTARPIRAGEFDEGPTYHTGRPAGTEDWLLILTADGAGLIRHAHGKLRVEPGDVLLWAPGAAQDYGCDPATGHWHLAWAHFVPRPHWHPWLSLPRVDGADDGIGIVHIDDSIMAEHVLGAVRDAVRLIASPLDQAPLLAMNALERALIWLDCVNPITGGRPLDDRVVRAVEYLRDHMTESITIEQLADEVHLSPSRLSHLFKDQVGLTPIQYLQKQRIERACQLLRQTALPVGQIAEALGYESPFYFSLRFKKHTGQSPRAYRQGTDAQGD